jgi:AraC-like DNA-binding protein
VSRLLAAIETLNERYGMAEREGWIPTEVEGVTLFRRTCPVPREPLFYEAGIVIIAQGHKVGYLDGRSFRYDAETYLVISVPLSIECETFASPEAPLLGLYVDVDAVTLAELNDTLQATGSAPRFDPARVPRGIEPAALSGELTEAARRLLLALHSPVDAAVLGPALRREILYRALLGPHGPALMALTEHQTPYARVARVLASIHRDCAASHTVDALARDAGMSASAFHRAFKQATGDTPLQYLKKTRLNQARRLIEGGGMRVSEAAFQVGYESPSQFSREFKRYFATAPSALRARAGSGKQPAGITSTPSRQRP